MVPNVRAVLGGLLAAALLVITASANATYKGGVAIDVLSVHLDVPSEESDAKLKTRHEIEITLDSTSVSNHFRLQVYAADLRAVNADTGQPLLATKNKNDWVTDIYVPMGRSRVKVTFTAPLFDNAMPRFWWDETDVQLGWPFSTESPQVQQRLDVEITVPLATSVPPVFPCVRVGNKKRCKQSFVPQQLTTRKDQRGKGLTVASIAADWKPFALSGGAIGAWALLLIAVAAYRVARGTPIGGGRGWMIGRTVIALGAYLVSIAAYAFVIDGVVNAPLATAVMYACAVLGIAGLMFAHLRREGSPMRTAVGRLLLLAVFPLVPAVMLVAKDVMLPLTISGMAGLCSLGAFFGENE